MSVNGSFKQPSFLDFIGEAGKWGMVASIAEPVIEGVINELRAAVEVCAHSAVAELVIARIDLLTR